jgi:hypothetical protein
LTAPTCARWHAQAAGAVSASRHRLVTERLTNFTSDQVFNYALSPDQRVALVRGQVLSDVVLISSESR